VKGEAFPQKPLFQWMPELVPLLDLPKDPNAVQALLTPDSTAALTTFTRRKQGWLQNLISKLGYLPVISREAVRIEQRVKREGCNFLKPICLENQHPNVFPTMDFMRDITSEPMLHWPAYAGVIRLLQALLPHWKERLKSLQAEFEFYQQQLAQTAPEILLEALKADHTQIVLKQQQFEKALLANLQDQITKLQQRSHQLEQLSQSWCLKPSELDLLQKAQLALRSHYQKQAFIQLLNDGMPMPLAELYVNLVVVKEEEQRDKEKRASERQAENQVQFSDTKKANEQNTAAVRLDPRKNFLGTYENIARSEKFATVFNKKILPPLIV
jgi:hypothetical protein